MIRDEVWLGITTKNWRMYWETMIMVNALFKFSLAFPTSACPYPPLLQQALVISDPDIHTFAITGEEDFLVLACDGLWDVMTPVDVRRVGMTACCNAK